MVMSFKIFKKSTFLDKKGEKKEGAYKRYVYSGYLFSLIEVLCIRWYKPFQL